MRSAKDAAPAAPTAADDAQERHRRGTRQLLLSRGVFFASAYVVSAILTRTLGPADYGIYGVVVSLLLWLEMVVHAGVPAATSKVMADGRHDPDEAERSARALLVGSSLLLLGIGWAASPAIASLMKIPDGAWLLRLAMLDLPFAAIHASYEGNFYGRRRFGALAAMQVAYGLIRVAAIAALVFVGFTVGRALLALVVSSLAVSLLMLVRHPPTGWRPRRQTMSEVVRFAGPMAICLVSGQVLVNLDLWSLQSLWTGSSEVVGQYVASLNLARALAVVPTVQAGVLFSSVAYAAASRDNVSAVRHVHEANRFAMVIAGGASVILGMNGADLLTVLFSGAYAEGRRFLPLQCLGFGLFAVMDVFSNALMAAGRQRVVAAVLTSIVPLVWLGNYLLVPRFGPVGAALSLVMGMAIGTFITGAMTRVRFGRVTGLRTLLRVLVAAAVVALISVALPLHGVAVLLKIMLLGALYLLVLYLLREITPRDFGLPVPPIEHARADGADRG